MMNEAWGKVRRVACTRDHWENVETLTKVYIALKFFKFQ